MFKKERQDEILYHLARDGKVIASRLAVLMDVSEDTIRRDLLELDQRGLLKRVFGGALPLDRPVMDYLDRENKDVEMKYRLASKALGFLKENQLIAIDGSSTNLQFARCIPGDLKLTVITNSFPIVQVCGSKTNIEVIMIGGQLFRKSMISVGDAAAQQARGYFPELCFMGVYGFHPEYGLTIPHHEEVSIKRQLIESSSKVLSFVAPNKLNTVSNYRVCGIEAFTTLITDDDVPEAALKAYRDRGLDCI